MDIGGNTDFTVKLTPEHEKPMYTQGPPSPIHLREDLFVELALMQYYGVITTLPYSKYSSPLFAQRKPSGALRLLIDLRRVNHLIRHDYDSHNFPITTLADASAHLAGKKLFAKLDCSQAYFAVRLADAQSVQLLSFNFFSRTFAFTRLAQGLSRFVSAFSSFMRKYLDACIAEDKCFQYVDDLGTAAHTFEELLDNLRRIFECIRKSGLKLTVQKCEFGLSEIQFLGSSITTQGMSPNREKVEKFLKSLKMPKTPKQIRRFIGFFQYFRAFLPKLSERLLPFYTLLRNNQVIQFTKEHHDTFETLKTDLAKSCDTALRLPQPHKQYVIMADASFYAAGFVLMIEDYLEDQAGKTVKKYVPVSFGSKIFNPTHLKLSIYAKEFLAVHFAFDSFAHILWESSKPTIVLTDNRSLTRFFQAKTIPSSLWSCVDHVLNFNFILGHIPGKANLAADYLSRMHINPHTKLELKIASKIPACEVDFNLALESPDNSLNIVCEDQNFHQLLNQDQFSINALEFVNPLDKFEMANSVEPLNLKQEQQKDPNIRKIVHWLRTKLPNDLSYLNIELQKLCKQAKRLEIQNGVLYRKFFDHTGRNFTRQFVVPSHLRKELIFRLHNSKFAGHLGIMKTVEKFRQLFHFPNFLEFLEDYIRNCPSCLQVKPPNNASLKPPLQSVATQQAFPGDLLQVDMVGQLTTSGGYKFILTAIDVFSKYMFAVPLRSASAESVAKALFEIFMKHSYLPTTILSDLGTNFTSKLMKEMCQLLEIKLVFATVKHPQTMGVIERSHSGLKNHLKLYDQSATNNWHKHVDSAVFVHNTSFHRTIGCTPSLLFHGRQPRTALDLRFQNKELKKMTTMYDFTTQIQDDLNERFSEVRDSTLRAYYQYRQYYDRKAAAHPLQKLSFCLLLNPKLVKSTDQMGKSLQKWLPLYRVEQVLTNSNYIVRKVGTNHTQCVHRI